MTATTALNALLQFITIGKSLTPSTTETVTVSNTPLEFQIGALVTLITDGGTTIGPALRITVTISGTSYAIYSLVSLEQSGYEATGWGVTTAPLSSYGLPMYGLGIAPTNELVREYSHLSIQIQAAGRDDCIDGLPIYYINENSKICMNLETVNAIKDKIIDYDDIYYTSSFEPTTTKIEEYNQYVYNLTFNDVELSEDDTVTFEQFEAFILGYTLFSTYQDVTGASTIKDNFEFMFTEDGYTGWEERRAKLIQWYNSFDTKDYIILIFAAQHSHTEPLYTHPIWFSRLSKSLYNSLINGETMWNVDSSRQWQYTAKSFVRPSRTANTILRDTNLTQCRYFSDHNEGSLWKIWTYGSDYQNVQCELDVDDIPQVFLLGALWLIYNEIYNHSDIYAQGWNYCYLYDHENNPRNINACDLNYTTQVWGKTVCYVRPPIDDRIPYGGLTGSNYFQWGQLIANIISTTYSGLSSIATMSSLGMGKFSTITWRPWVVPSTTPADSSSVRNKYTSWAYHTYDSLTLMEVNPLRNFNVEQINQQRTNPWPNDTSRTESISQKIMTILTTLTNSTDPDFPDDPTPPGPVDDDVPNIPDFDITTLDPLEIYTVWWPTVSQVNQLARFIWSDSWLSILENIWSNPLAPIISFRRVFATPTSINTGTIYLGKQSTNVQGVRLVSRQYERQNLGSIFIPETVGNATDYSPYTQMHLYLPFIGIHEVDVDDFMAKYITIRYTFDIYTGICLAEVFKQSSGTSNKQLLYAYTGNAGQEIPLSSATFQGLVNTIISATTATVTAAAGGMAAAGAAGAVGGAGGAVGIDPFMSTTASSSLGLPANSLFHEMVHYTRSGAMVANAGVIGNRYPQIIISNRNRYDAASYSSLYGYPANKSVYLGNLSGYAKVKAVQLGTFATQPEKTELELLLKGGVIF